MLLAAEFRAEFLPCLMPGDELIDQQKVPLDQLAEYYRLKYRFALALQPRDLVEIGVRAGYSAWAFLRGSPGARYTGLDAYNNQHGGIDEAIALPWAMKILAGRDATIRRVDTQQLSALPVADFYHVDGDHSAKGVLHDLEMCWRSLRPGGVILVDDLDYIAEVGTTAETFLARRGFPCTQRFPGLRGELLIFKDRAGLNSW